MSIKVGDTFAMKSRSRLGIVTVTKVGRTYFYVDGPGREDDNKFYLKSLEQQPGVGNRITRTLYPSIEAYEEILATDRLRSKITFNIRDTGLRYMDATQLKALADILGVDYE